MEPKFAGMGCLPQMCTWECGCIVWMCMKVYGKCFNFLLVLYWSCQMLSACYSWCKLRKIPLIFKVVYSEQPCTAKLWPAINTEHPALAGLKCIWVPVFISWTLFLLFCRKTHSYLIFLQLWAKWSIFYNKCWSWLIKSQVFLFLKE